ncbi:PIN domain-containing protein [Methylocystis sp. S23]
MKLSAYTVFLDACVLYPAPLRDFLMELAAARLFRAKWSEAAHEEWIRNLLKDKPDLSQRRLERTKQLMNRAVPDCLVSGYGDLAAGLQLPDPGDRHILAAAIHAECDAIITFNLSDFSCRFPRKIQHRASASGRIRPPPVWLG